MIIFLKKCNLITLNFKKLEEQSKTAFTVTLSYHFVIAYHIYIYCKEFSDNLDAALPLNLLLIDRIGRRYTGAVNSCGMAIFFLLLQVKMPQSLLTVIMFMVRGLSQGLFNFVYIYTAEVCLLLLYSFSMFNFKQFDKMLLLLNSHPLMWFSCLEHP